MFVSVQCFRYILCVLCVGVPVNRFDMLLNPSGYFNHSNKKVEEKTSQK